MNTWVKLTSNAFPWFLFPYGLNMPTDPDGVILLVSLALLPAGATLIVSVISRWQRVGGLAMVSAGVSGILYSVRGLYLPHLIELQTAIMENETLKTVAVWNRKIIPFLAVVAGTGLIGMSAFILWMVVKVWRQERRRPPRF